MKNQVKKTLGMILSQLLPRRTQQIKDNFFAPYWESKDIQRSRLERVVENCIRLHLASNSIDSEQGEGLEEIHRSFWQREMDVSWHEEWIAKFYDEVIPQLQNTLEQLDIFIGKHDFETICEIGTGNGEMLAYLNDRFRNRYKMIGIDVSVEATEKAAENHPTFTFAAGDAKEWILKNGQDKTLYLTNHGVYEYFSQTSLETIFGHIKREQPNSALAMICEPVADSHDLANERNSILTTKGEYSFSHNHAALIENMGLTVHHKRENTDLGYRSMTLFACSESK